MSPRDWGLGPEQPELCPGDQPAASPPCEREVRGRDAPRARIPPHTLGEGASGVTCSEPTCGTRWSRGIGPGLDFLQGSKPWVGVGSLKMVMPCQAPAPPHSL